MSGKRGRADEDQASTSSKRPATTSNVEDSTSGHVDPPQQQREQQQGYDKSKHGPIAFGDLDPKAQEVLTSVKGVLQNLSTRAGGFVPVDSDSNYGRVEALADETAQDIIDKVKKHPILARALSEQEESLLEIVLRNFGIDYGDDASYDDHDEHLQGILDRSMEKALLFLVQENPFSLLYLYKTECMWPELSSREVHGPTRFVFDNPSLRWMFEHPSVQKSGDQILISFGAVLDSIKNGDSDWAKQFISEMFPNGWVDSKDEHGNTLLHMVCSQVESFDNEFIEWMIREDPKNLFCIQNNLRGDTPLHEICYLVARGPCPEWSFFDMNLSRDRANTVKSIVERFPETNQVQNLSGETPFMYLLSGLLELYDDIDDFVDEYRENHWQDHIKLVVGVAESMLQSSPQVASIGNRSQKYPLDTLERLRGYRPIQDLVESICRAAYPSFEYTGTAAFYLLLHGTLQREAGLAKKICDMKEVHLLLRKANKTQNNTKVSDEAVECYRLWANDRIRKLSASIKTIQEVEIPKLKEHLSRPQEQVSLPNTSTGMEELSGDDDEEEE